MAIEVHVATAGAITPLGTSAALTCAAVRARLSRAQLDETDDGVGYHRALVDALPPDLPRLARLRVLLASALGDALAPLRASGSRGQPRTVPLWLALPEDVRARDLLTDSVDGFALSLVETLSRGQASSLLALKAAVQSIASGQHELALVAGVDVRSDEQGVAALARSEQLLTEDNPWGIVPSEGAAAVLVVSARVRDRLGLPSLGVVVAVAESSDDAEHRGVPCVGEGLSQACHEVLDALAEQTRAAEVYGDLSGRRARADEWGYTAPRLAPRCRDVTEAHMPALWWGDQGHATGMLLVALALYDGARGHALGKHVLVWATSERDLRAAVLLSVSVDAPTVVPLRAPSELDREIVEELLSEARFVFGQRSAQRAELEDHAVQGDAGVAASEERLERYVDGLVVMHEAALHICANESVDASLAYVMLRVLAAGTSIEPLIAMLSDLPLTEPAFHAAAREALSDAGGPLVRQLSQALVSASHPAPMVALGLWLCGDQGAPCDVPWKSVWHEGPERLGTSFPYAIGRRAKSEHAALLDPWLESGTPALVEEACLALLRLDPKHAHTRLWQLRWVPGAQLPLALICRRGEQHALFEALLSAPPETIDLALGLLGTVESAERLFARLGESASAAMGLHWITGHEPLEQVDVAVVTPDEELSADELELRREGDSEVGVERERVTRLICTREVWAPIMESHRQRFTDVRTRLGQPLGPLADAKVLEHPRLAPSLKRLCVAATAALDVPRHPRVRDFARVAASLRG